MAAAQKAAKEAAEKALRATLNMVQMTPEDLAKVQVVPAVVGFVGIFVNLAMFFATHSAGWLAGTRALHANLMSRRRPPRRPR